MTRTVGDFVVRRLYEWGVQRIYGYPGDGINGIIGALSQPAATPSSSRCATRRWPRSWPARTPSSPARSACAWPPPARARSTCSTASTTRSSTTSRWWRSSGSRRARRWAATTSRRSICLAVQGRGARVRADGRRRRRRSATLVDRAMRIAGAERTVTCVIVPNDVQEMEAVEECRRASTARCTPASGYRRRA